VHAIDRYSEAILLIFGVKYRKFHCNPN